MVRLGTCHCRDAYGHRRASRDRSPHGPHDVDTFEIVWTILLEDRCVLPHPRKGPGVCCDISRISVPGRRWIWMVIGNLPSL
jgi:hypothetical protein